MKRFGLPQLLLYLLAGTAVWLAVAAGCLAVGPTGGIGWPAADAPYIWAFRETQVGLASLVGATLAAAGVAYQATLRNPLADPYLLGVSSGAALASYLWTLPAGAFGLAVAATYLGQQAFAFAGALAAVGVVFALAGWRGRAGPGTIILVGVIVNSLCGSVFLLVNSLAKERGGGAVAFLVGGIQTNLEPLQIWSATAVAAAGFCVLLWIGGALNVASLDDAEAAALGIRVNRLRWTALIVASLMTAAAVAVSGPIGFVGLICPHLARLVVGHDVRRLLPAATALGACLLAVADAASRYLAGVGSVGTILPVGVLTGLLGGPFFLLLLLQRRNGSGN